MATETQPDEAPLCGRERFWKPSNPDVDLGEERTRIIYSDRHNTAHQKTIVSPDSKRVKASNEALLGILLNMELSVYQLHKRRPWCVISHTVEEKRDRQKAYIYVHKRFYTQHVCRVAQKSCTFLELDGCQSVTKLACKELHEEL